MSLGTYLDELADTGRPLKTARLTNLTQLSDGERRDFGAKWALIDPERRLQIVQRLSDLAEDNAELNFDTVLMQCLTDPDPRVRSAAIEGLWEYEERDLIAPLLDLLRHDEDARVRANVALALGRYVVLGEFERLQPADLTAIEDALAETAHDPAEPDEVRARAIEAIGARSEPWVRDLIAEAYTSGVQRLQVSAIHAMGRSCDADWLDEVLEQFRSDDAEMRYEAATAAGMIGEERAVPELVDLIDDEDSEVQETAIEALAEIGGPEARGALKQRTRHPDARIRELAGEALASMELAGTPVDDDDEGGAGL